MQLAGPLVEALNKAAKAMLEAKTSGKEFFDVLRAGFTGLFLGDDAHIFNEKMAEAGETLVRAQNALDKLRHTGGSGLAFVKDLQEAEAAVKAAEARIKALQTMKDMLVPKDPAAPARKDDSVTVPGDPNAAGRDNEFIAKQLEEGLAEEQRRPAARPRRQHRPPLVA